MTRNTFVTEQPVVLDGFQAVLKPGKFGYKLTAVVGQDIADKLEEDRVDGLKWCQSRLKNPKRSVVKPEPWEEVSEGKYQVKFSWNEETKPPIVDTEGTPITNEDTPLYSGSTVKLAFQQKPYILRDDVTYGTSLKIKGIQIVTLSSSAGVDMGDLTTEDAAALFGPTAGFKASEPNVMPAEPSSLEDANDF